MNFAKANQNLHNLGNMLHDQVGSTSVGIDIISVDIPNIPDGNRIVQQVAHQVVKAILVGNGHNATFFYQVFHLLKTQKLWPDDNGNAKHGRFHGIVQTSSKATTYISNIGIAVNFGQKPNGINDKNLDFF